MQLQFMDLYPKVAYHGREFEWLPGWKSGLQVTSSLDDSEPSFPLTKSHLLVSIRGLYH